MGDSDAMSVDPSRPSDKRRLACDQARALYQAGRLGEAREILEGLRAAGDMDFDVLHLLGVIAAGRGDIAQAESLVRQALSHAPGHAEGLRNHGALLRGLGRADEALAAYGLSLKAHPDAPDTHANLANLLNDLHRSEAALAAADRALVLSPAHAQALNARGNALRDLGRPLDAIAAYEAALAARPDHFEAQANRAASLMDLGRPGAALEGYGRAAALAPRAVALAGRGNALAALGRWTEAVQAYDAAFAADPNEPFLAGARLHAKMKVCDWSRWDADTADLAARIEAGAPATVPFPTLAAPVPAALQRRAAETYVRRLFGEDGRAPRTPGPDARIRIGYFSGDLHAHATAYLAAELFELHDREAFEVTAFSFGPESPDPMRGRLRAAFERFIDVRPLQDLAIADMARELRIDIAVDLKGFTTGSRPGIFAQRAAPIQVSWLGYPGTMGAPFIDYLVADPVVVPPSDVDHYREKLAWVAGCYQPNDRRREIAPIPTRRADHGLPEAGFVFAAFNNAFKITPQVFAVWMRLLQATPGSVLWLFEDGGAAVNNLLREAAARGVDPDRLVFAQKAALPVHLERHRHAGLFLDTAPYNAHTTASDALWAGLPVLTVGGETFAARVAESLLRAQGLGELVAPDLAGYERLAMALAREPEKLAKLGPALAAARSQAPFDTPALTRDLERLYRTMHARRLAGLRPDHIPPGAR